MKLGFALPKYYEAGVREPYRKTFELAHLAEEAGFWFGAVPNHSFTPDTEDYAAPLLMMAALAARTLTLKLLSCIYILPLHQPMAVAEQLTELDRISGGRLIFGAGAGYRDYEFAGHGIDFHSRGRRMDEMLAIIRAGLESGSVEHTGEFFKIPRTVIAPLAVQKPHPPIWIGGTVDAVLRRAGRFGDGWLSENLFMLEAIKERIATYHRFCLEFGRPRGQVAVIRNSNVAETSEEVERTWLPNIIKYHLFNRANYRKAGISMPDPDGVYARLEAGKPVGYKEFIRGRAIAGTPDDCIEQIKLWERETECDYLLLATSPLITTDEEFAKQKRFIRLFGKEIIPAI
jgi:probable F420-dependent oxidoreductase